MAWLIDYPREKINWGPTIDEKKCVGCGMCLNCGKQVYDWKNGKACVARHDDCVVGCTTCANLCPGKAISFPDIEEVRALYKKEGIWAKMTSFLKKQGKIK
ncbi:MAG: ferredoxin family protein [Gammaproteobacteria bacterium]|nr:ferredoxin family protein [Gammaproteobacteria bacterium]